MVTHRFDPLPLQGVRPDVVTVRFSGTRLGVEGKPGNGDRFTHDEVVDDIAKGAGPISVTARVRGVSPGDWEVTAKAFPGRKTQAAPPAAWSPLPWQVPEGVPAPVATCPAPFARVPGLVRGGWITMVTLGLALGLAVQSLVASSAGILARSVWPVSLLGIVVGIAGAKVWFLVKHRGEGRIEGWCVQGFVAGFALVTLPTLAGLGTPIGAFFDAAAPGLLLGLAVGRLGCLLGGCCGGRPSAGHLALWSSDQRVGRRRIPTQLLESALSLAIGIGALVAILLAGAQGGGVFVAALAAYVAGRQPILGLRAEPTRWTRAASPLLALGVSALVADLACLAALCARW